MGIDYLDFTTFSKNDPNLAITLAQTRITFTDFHQEEDAWAYYDYGVAYFTDFEHWLELHISAIDETGSVIRGFISLAETGVDNWVINDANNQVGIYLKATGTPNEFAISIIRSYSGLNYTGTSVVGLSVGTTYYLKWIKSGGMDLTVEVYSDAARQNLIGSATYSDGIDASFQYLMGIQSWTAGTNDEWMTGYVQNYSLTPAPAGTADLAAEFYVPIRDTADLKAVFLLNQDTENLKAEFIVGQWQENLYAQFYLPIRESVDLFAYFEVNQVNASVDLMAKFGVRRIYDLSGSGGIGFWWEGVGRGHVDFQMITPTGAWIGKFPDYAGKTWVPLTWDDLQEVDIDGSRPDKTQVTGFLWTVHSAGERHLDGLVGLPKGGDREVFSVFTVRHPGTADLGATFYLPLNLFSEFIVQHPNTADLAAEFLLRQETEDLHGFFHVGQNSVDMAAEMFIQYKFKDLKAEFILRQLTSDLAAEFEVSGLSLEVYNIVGTSGSFIFTGADEDIPEMVKALACSAGDKLVITFDGTLQSGTSDEVEFNIEIDGVEIGERVRFDRGSSGTEWRPISVTRVYECPSDATYTMKARGYAGVSSPRMYLDQRNFAVQHFS